MGGMTRLLLLLWAGVTVGTVVDLQKRIIGGEDCSATERGYHAFLTFNNGTDDFVCGGSLIDKQWILTAAHCWETGWTIKAVLGRDPQSEATVGIEQTPKLFEDKDDKGSTRKHDIMLLKLLKPAADIETVPLPDCKNKPKVGKTVQIAGYYSKTKPRKEHGPDQLDLSKPLQCAKTKVVKCDEFSLCLAADYPYTHSLEQLLCYQEKNVDISPGDSGGGVVFNKMIYGVIVTSDDEACAWPAQAMDVCEYRDWIDKTIAISTREKFTVALKKLCCIS